MQMLRRVFGISQEQLAEHSGVSKHQIANLESRRKKHLTVDELAAFARTFGVTPAFLLGLPTPDDERHLRAHLSGAHRASSDD
jgi:transcriptional regulator with XRE-family HTH domain